MRARADRLSGDAGSSLILMPVAVLVVLLLGAIAVDLAGVRLAQADLLDVAAGAANDAATDALDQNALRADGTFVLDLDLANASLDRTLGRRHLLDRVSRRSIHPGPEANEVTVELELPVSYFFAKAIAGSRPGATVRARASASLRRR